MTIKTDTEDKRSAVAAAKELRAREAAEAMREYRLEQLRIAARTERLRALRLAREREAAQAVQPASGVTITRTKNGSRRSAGQPDSEG